MTMDVKFVNFSVDNGINFKPIYGNIQSYVDRLNNPNQPAAIIDLSIQNQVLNGDFPFSTSDTRITTGPDMGLFVSGNPANISNYAWQYKVFYDTILQNTSGEDQTKLLNKLDQTFADLANKQADQISKSFSGFFNYQQRIYTKYLGEDTDKLFDDKEFKNHLLGLFKGAVQAAINSNDPENAITNYLAQDSADGTPEHMSFNDIYALNKEYFFYMPSLENAEIVPGMKGFFIYQSVDDVEARGNQVTQKIVNSNILSPQTQKLIEQVSAQKFKLFEKVYAYEDTQTKLTNEQSESYKKSFLDDLKKDKQNYSQFLKNLTA